MSEANAVQIESCPFCGHVDDRQSSLAPENEYVLFEYDDKHGKRYYWACEMCNTCGPYGRTEDEATRRWNTRKFVPSDAIDKHKILLEQSYYITQELCAAERLSELLVKAIDAAKILSRLDYAVDELNAEIVAARKSYKEAVAREIKGTP